MTVGHRRFLAILALLGFATAASATQPSPPPQFCVNSKCANLTDVASTSSTGNTGGFIKWNPGNYMASEGILYGSGTLSSVQPEMDDINGYGNIIGYRIMVSWGALEPTEGNYDFSVLDAILNRLKTAYHQPKHLVVTIVPGTWAGAPASPANSNVLPAYLQNDSTYGPSPSSGSYGWWGPKAGGYAAALYRPAVMDRMIALVQALGQHYDADPYFEALMFQEDAWMVGLWSTASDYSASKAVTQFERLLTAATAAFPHTSIVMENTWAGDVSLTQNFEQWMVNNRIAPGTADTVGQSAFNAGYASSPQGLNWGLQAYMGIVASGSSYTGGDLRPHARAMLDVEPFDMQGDYYSNWSAPAGYKPADILAALNNTYQASHAFWAHLFGNETANGGGGTVSQVSPWAVWSKLAPIINDTPLTHTAYPANYR